jgi:hypothetical protein
MSKASQGIIVCALALLAAAAARAEPAVIGLARAYLGPDSTLSGISSIHFVGTLDRVNPDRAAGEIHGSLDLIFVKPLRQRLIVRTDKSTLTTVLDGYDAWDLFQDNADGRRPELKWLSAGDIKTLRANTWENLNFFRGLEGEGAVVDKGPATADSIACERVDFTHGPGIVYERYFDRDTGRLVLTASGPETIRESGEIRVDGLRFAKTIISVTKLPSGKDLLSTVTFSSIVLNEPVGPDVFSVPSLIAPKAAMASAGSPSK